jgi:hypothetical protein
LFLKAAIAALGAGTRNLVRLVDALVEEVFKIAPHGAVGESLVMNAKLAQGVAILQNKLGLEKHNGKQNGQYKQAPFGNGQQCMSRKSNEPVVQG